MVLNVSIFCIAVKGFQVYEVRYVWVRRGAVIAFIKIIGQNLPIILAIEFIGTVFEKIQLVS